MWNDSIGVIQTSVPRTGVSSTFAVRNSQIPCPAPLLYFLRNRSALSRQIEYYFRDVYENPDFFDNPLRATRARVDFVVRNESSSGHAR